MKTVLSSRPVVNRRKLDLHGSTGFIVADERGRLVGKVECPMYGRAPDRPDALSVRSGFLFLHRLLVPAETIESIDPEHGVVRLRTSRDRLKAFL